MRSVALGLGCRSVWPGDESDDERKEAKISAKFRGNLGSRDVRSSCDTTLAASKNFPRYV